MSQTAVVVADAGYGNETEVSGGNYRTGIEVCGGRPEFSVGVGTRHKLPAALETAQNRGRPPTSCDETGASAGLGKATGPDLPARSMEDRYVAAGHQEKLRSRFAALRVRPHTATMSAANHIRRNGC